MVKFVPAALLTLVTLACTDGPPSPLVPEEPGAFLRSDRLPQEARYIVTLASPPATATGVSASMASLLGFDPDYVYSHAISGFAARLNRGQLTALRNNPLVQAIELDGIVTITTTQTPVPSWGLDRVDQQALALDNSYTYNASGVGVTFYGIDTGIRATHQDFGTRMLPGADFIGDGNGTNDCNGHGTHTASTAAGVTYGIAKNMNIVPVRVLGCGGSGTFAQVIAGVDWVAANASLPAVANMSLDGGAFPTLDAAVASAVAQGVVFTLAAGNNAANACNYSPGREPTGITVGSTTITDARSSFSNFGSCLDLFAPGSAISAAWHTSNSATNTISGTSMAAPHVAGVAGLYLETDPTASPAAVAQVIGSNATLGAVGNPGGQSPNFLLYMGFIGGGPPPPPNQPPVASWTWSAPANVVTFDATSSTDPDGTIVLYEWLALDGGVLRRGVIASRRLPNGSRPITLRVTDDDGAIATLTQTITVPAPASNQPPVASFTFSCTDLTCNLDGTSSTDDTGITLYVWTDGGGTTLGTGALFAHTFASSGSKPVTLTVTDQGSLTDAVTQTLVVTDPPPNQPPVASFTFGCTDLTCNLDGTSSTDDTGITSYAWTDGGGTTLGTGALLTHTFASSGSKPVTLTVTDQGGLTDAVTQTLVVTGPPPNQPPLASWTWSASGNVVTFNATSSSDPDGTIVLYEWLAPDGGVLRRGVIASRRLPNGSRPITLRVTDDDGATATLTQTITIGGN